VLELVVRLVLGGGVLLGALFALRWAQSRGMTARGGPELRIVGRTGLTRTSLVAVVAVDDRRFLVGASDGRVDLLAELDPILDLDREAAALHANEGLAPFSAPAQFGVQHDSTTHPLGVHRTDATIDGPRIGPLDRLRMMTVRTHTREPIRAEEPLG
jgi:flagellar biogenesis protein FliO